MNNTETITDHWVEQAVRLYGDSDAALKKHSIYAATIVGRYQLDGTRTIAKQIKRSTSTVENYAHAFSLYAELRQTTVRSHIRTLWRTLPISHWWQAWSIQKAGYDAQYYLANAAAHGWSGREMMDNYKKDIEAGNAPLVFKRGVYALRELATELLNKFNGKLTEAQRVALLTIIDSFELAER